MARPSIQPTDSQSGSRLSRPEFCLTELPLSGETKTNLNSIPTVPSLHLYTSLSSRQQWRQHSGETSQAASPGSSMACLAPQFMWAPYAAAHVPSSSSSYSRCSALRVHCAVTSAVVVQDGSAAQLRLAYAAPAIQVARTALFLLDCLPNYICCTVFARFWCCV